MKPYNERLKEITVDSQDDRIEVKLKKSKALFLLSELEDKKEDQIKIMAEKSTIEEIKDQLIIMGNWDKMIIEASFLHEMIDIRIKELSKQTA